MIAAPIAAWLVTKISPAVLGTGVGGVIVITNLQKLFATFEVAGPIRSRSTPSSSWSGSASSTSA